MNNTLLQNDWKFTLNENSNNSTIFCDDSTWRSVSVPHDYAVEGAFDENNDLQEQTVFPDGILTAIRHVARTGGLPINENAWYRKHFFVDKNSKHVFLQFDAVMCNGDIYVNGQFVTRRPYGYTSFCVDITKHVYFGQDNLLCVHTQPMPCATRFYPGAGIIRKVTLLEKDTAFIPYMGQYIIPLCEDNKYTLTVHTNVEIKEKATYTVKTSVYNQDGALLKEDISPCTEKTVQAFTFDQVQLWSTKCPYLYTVQTDILKENTVIDTNSTRIGFRSLLFTPDKGFFLNGKHVHLKGVCLHHDLGALGAAFNKSAARRQLEIMQEMGVNALRTTHNPPAPEVLDLADEMGILVIDEAFDEWKEPKVDNSYSHLFDEWAEKDMTDLVRRDRNHPSVIMWSTGNEMPDQRTEEGKHLAKFLSDICHREDKYRPTTAGFDDIVSAIKNGVAQEVDIIGLNYKPHLYKELHEAHPTWIFYGSETESCVSSRGEYYKIVEENDIEKPIQNRDTLHCNAYDNATVPWGWLPDDEILMQKECPYILGQFTWTGFDYLGEPTPYRLEWPSRSSYFGIVDLAGMKKDRYYLYQSEWTDKKVMHILPHWNFNDDDTVDVHIFSSANKVELFLNDISLGIREKTDKEGLLNNLRLIYKNIPFKKGTLKAVDLEDSTNVGYMRTADAPHHLFVQPEKNTISLKEDELVYVLVEMQDEKGTCCPHDSTKFTIQTEGALSYVASDGGDQTSTRTFNEAWCNLFHGKAMVILRGNAIGCGKLVIKAEGFQDAHCTIEVV